MARYHSSVQGRFTGVDPQNIVLEKERGRSPQEETRILQSYLVQPQNWNRYTYTRNSPLSYTDPNGRCSVPAGLSKGNVGICIEAFIATATIGNSSLAVGLGDNRGFAANDPSKTNKIQVIGTITPGQGTSGWSYDLTPSAGRSSVIINGVPIIGSLPVTLQGTFKFDVKTTGIDGKGAHLTISITGDNAFKDVPGGPDGAISLVVKVLVTPDGKVGLEGGERTAYPSVGIYAYTMGPDGKPISVTLGEANESVIEALTQPPVPIQQVDPKLEEK